jgi:hypothetical protein
VLAGLTAAAVAAGTGLLLPGTASAAVPVFPDNITIFPNRDFVSIDGFIGNAGKPITIEVVRGGTVIGSATGTEATAEVINAGNPAIEVNHPGGICWGAGGGINATPDIQPSDQIVVKLGTSTAASAADATTLSPQVTGHSLDQAGTTLTVTGTFGPDVDPTFLEQRVINPDLRPTDVNFRDVRAVPGPLTPDRRSPAAYSSGMDVNAGAHTFTATYLFASAATAKIADAGAMRSMSWQNLDANANRQGVTIQEDGELGGPGFGGCPAAAVAQGPASPTAVKATDNGDNTTTVTWTKPTVTPGTSPIVGYTVRAVSQTSTGGGQDEIGKRLSDPAATTATLSTGLAGKTVEVRSYTAAGESWPPAVANKTATGAPTDFTIPTVTAAPPGGSFAADVTVTLTPSETSTMVYTLDGSDPLIAADANPNATAYDPAKKILIAAKDAAGNFIPSVTLRYVAFDTAGNPSLAHTEIYKFGAASGPAAPTMTATPGNGTIAVTWTAPANTGSSPITGYKLTATAQGAAAPAATVTPLSSATTATLTGLTNGTTYTVSLLATNATGDGTPATATVSLAAAPTETITAGAPVNKANDFRVKGTSSATSGSVSLFNTDAAGNQTGAALAASPLTAAVAPATGTTYDLRARTTIAAGKKLIIVGSNGGKLTITS